MAPWQNRLPTIAQDVCVEPPAVAASDETAIEDTLCSMTLVANSKFWVPPYYESFRWIGSGSFGVVAACWDAERKAKSAIKRIKPMVRGITAPRFIRSPRAPRLQLPRRPPPPALLSPNYSL